MKCKKEKCVLVLVYRTDTAIAATRHAEVLGRKRRVHAQNGASREQKRSEQNRHVTILF